MSNMIRGVGIESSSQLSVIEGAKVVDPEAWRTDEPLLMPVVKAVVLSARISSSSSSNRAGPEMLFESVVTDGVGADCLGPFFLLIASKKPNVRPFSSSRGLGGGGLSNLPLPKSLRYGCLSLAARLACVLLFDVGAPMPSFDRGLAVALEGVTGSPPGAGGASTPSRSSLTP